MNRARRRALDRHHRAAPAPPAPAGRNVPWPYEEGARVVAQAAWCRSVDQLESLRRRTHDSLVDQLGDNRVGPVRWMQRSGEDAHRLLDHLAARVEADLLLLDYYHRIRAKLRERGGWLVVAVAERQA